MRVLIGVDDSDHSNAAVDYVKKAEWPDGTKVFVLSAVRAPVMVNAEVYAPGPYVSDQAFEEAIQFGQELTARVEKQFRDAGFATEARVVHGDPRVVIVDTAHAVGADLVVVGSHGRSGLAKLVLGSVASHVVSHAPCSVLVVKKKG
jgi:nucleotide-binding universal stress UspA family protein